MSVEIVGFMRIRETLQKVDVLVAVEPAPLLRVIEHLFRRRPEFRIVTRRSGGSALVRQASHLRPELIIFNMRLLGQEASKIIREVKLASPGSKLIVTGFLQGFRLHARECGADAYLEEEQLVRRLVPTAQRLLSQRQLAPGKCVVQSRRTSISTHSFSVRSSRATIFADLGQVVGR